MATTATDVYWSKDYVNPLTGKVTFYKGRMLTVAESRPLLEPFDFYPDDPKHECDVIQRMSEAYRANVYA